MLRIWRRAKKLFSVFLCNYRRRLGYECNKVFTYNIGGDSVFSNEMLLYCGLTVAGVSAIILLVFLIVFFIGKVKLNAKFDKEYGELPKKKSSNI